MNTKAGLMKWLSALLVCLLPFVARSKGLRVDLSSYSQYRSYDMNGLTLVLHRSLTKDKARASRCLRFWRDCFSRYEKIAPATARSFKKNKYKIYLYSLPSTRGGMEFIRKNTHLWDRRINSYVDKAIIIPRAYSYSFDAEESLAYIVHEMAHYRHIVMLGEYGSYNKKIKAAYTKALQNPKYRGTYAATNHLEYFAETSMAYLLKKHSVSTFPAGSRELYNSDGIGYKLCQELWGENLAAYKPVQNTNWAAANTPAYSGKTTSPRLDVISDLQIPKGRTLFWTVGSGQRLRLDRLYVGQKAEFVLKAFGQPDGISWSPPTWSYHNLSIHNPATFRRFTTVNFSVRNRKITGVRFY